MATTAQTLQARIEQLEHGRRRDRAIVFGVIALALATAQAPPVSPSISQTPITVSNAQGTSTLTATGLVVNDSAGHRRILIGFDSNSWPTASLSDSNGKTRESLYLFGDTNGTLRQFDVNGKRRLELRVTDPGNGELQLSDANENLRAAFFFGTNGNPQLGLYGTDVKLRAFLATDDIAPYFVIRDATGQNRIDIGGFTDGSIGMDLRDASNTVLWKAP
jgi:hypothetical protein